MGSTSKDNGCLWNYLDRLLDLDLDNDLETDLYRLYGEGEREYLEIMLQVKYTAIRYQDSNKTTSIKPQSHIRTKHTLTFWSTTSVKPLNRKQRLVLRGQMNKKYYQRKEQKLQTHAFITNEHNPRKYQIQQK